jgi:hypothetical protein
MQNSVKTTKTGDAAEAQGGFGLQEVTGGGDRRRRQGGDRRRGGGGEAAATGGTFCERRGCSV